MGLAGRWQLHPLHLSLVRSYLKLEDLTLPLEGQNFGRTTQQIGELVQREYQTMEQYGIVANDEIQPQLDKALRLLAKPYLWVDSMWFPQFGSNHMWRTVAAITEGNTIVLGVQGPGETERYGGVLTVEVHENVPLPQVFLPTLPPAPPGNHSAVAVPETSFKQDQRADEEEPDSYLQAGRPDKGGSGDRQLAAYTAIGDGTKVRGGQIAANMRDRNGKVHRSPVLKWFDNAEPDGRYLDHNQRGPTGETLYLLTPADARLIAGKLDEMVAHVRAAAR